MIEETVSEETVDDRAARTAKLIEDSIGTPSVDEDEVIRTNQWRAEQRAGIPRFNTFRGPTSRDYGGNYEDSCEVLVNTALVTHVEVIEPMWEDPDTHARRPGRYRFHMVNGTEIEIGDFGLTSIRDDLERTIHDY